MAETRGEQRARMRREAAVAGVPLTDRSMAGEPMALEFFDRRFPDEAQYGRVAVTAAGQARNDALTATTIRQAKRAVAREDLASAFWALLLVGWVPVVILWGMLGDWFHLPDVVALPVAVIVTVVLFLGVL